MQESNVDASELKRSSGWWWKIPLGLIALILMLLVIVVWQLTPIATAVANQVLPAQLGTDAAVERVEVKLWKGYAAVHGLRIGQPEGFGEEALIELDHVDVEVDVGSAIGRDPLVVRRVELDGLRANVIKKADGALNVEQIGPPKEAGGEATPSPAGQEAPPNSEPSPEAAPPLPGLKLNSLTVKNVAVTYVDESLGSEEEPIELAISDLGIILDGLVGFDSALANQPASLKVQAKVQQPDLPAALLDVESRIGLITMGVPDVNAQIVLTGLLLETFGSLVPPGIETAIGGSGADVAASLGLNSKTVDLAGKVTTDQGNKYPIGVKGPLDSPTVDLGPLLMSVIGRIGGGLAKRAVAGAADGAMDLARGAGGEAVDLATDTGDAAKEVAGGLFRSATSLLKGDVKSVGEGVKDATVGVAADAAGDVKEAAGGVGDAAKDTGKSVTGGERSEKWMQAISSRHQEAVDGASVSIGDMPWPPPVVSEDPPKADPS